MATLHTLLPMDAAGLVQRCVIVQRDEHGFGLTVSGDNPVFVQSVREDGAAMRSGVQQGDRIIKVNGTLVTQSNHLEVVHLIKSGSYVALTLLGRPPGSPDVSPSLSDTQTIAPTRSPYTSLVVQGSPATLSSDGRVSPLNSADRRSPHFSHHEEFCGSPEFYDQHTRSLKQVLQERQPGYILDGYHRSGSETPTALADVHTPQNRLHMLESQVQPTNIKLPRKTLGTPSQSVDSRFLQTSADDVSQAHLDSVGQPDLLSSLPENSGHRKASLAEDQHEVTHRRLTEEGRSASLDFPRLSMPSSAPPYIVGPEEEDFLYDSEQVDNEGVFSRLDKLKEKPAHMAVFLQYVVSQHDPSPLLFFLSADSYLQDKDPRKQLQLFALFVEKYAPLKVNFHESLQSELDESKHKEEIPQQTLEEAQDFVLKVIDDQLLDYRSKSEMGLGSLYGENELSNLCGSPHAERMAAEQLSFKLMDIIGKMEEDRKTAMMIVVQRYMNSVGVRMKWARPAPSFERQQIVNDKKIFNILPKKKAPLQNRKEKETLKENDKEKKRFSIFKENLKMIKNSQPTFHVSIGNDAPKMSLPRIARVIPPVGPSIEPTEPSELEMHNIFLSQSPVNNSSPRLPHRTSLASEDTDMDPGREGLPAMGGRRQSDQLVSPVETRGQKRARLSLENTSTDVPADEDAGDSDSIASQTVSEVENPSRQSLVSVQSEDDHESEQELEAPNWQNSVDPELLKKLNPREIKRQEVINELFQTEKKHLQNLKLLQDVFYARLQPVLNTNELRQIFMNLDQIVPIHETFNESMKKIREKNQVVHEIGKLVLDYFSGEEGQTLTREAAEFCSMQSMALEAVRAKQKESRFQQLMAEAECSPKCRRLQFKDFLLTEMQRLTKYPLLLQNMLKYTTVDHPDHDKLEQAGKCCRNILFHVNEAVREREYVQKLEDYQKKLDLSYLERSSNPLVSDFKNLDLTQRKMIHEGQLTWKINKEKTLELHVLLLEDILVLTQKQDERLVLRCYSKTFAGATDAKQTFSPVIKLSSVLIRRVATDKKAFFVITTSQLGPQIYELVAANTKDMDTWKRFLDQACEKQKPRDSSNSSNSFKNLQGPRGYKKQPIIMLERSADPLRPHDNDEKDQENLSFMPLTEEILAEQDKGGDESSRGEGEGRTDSTERLGKQECEGVEFEGDPQRDLFNDRSEGAETGLDTDMEEELISDLALRDVHYMRRLLSECVRVISSNPEERFPFLELSGRGSFDTRLGLEFGQNSGKRPSSWEQNEELEVPEPNIPGKQIPFNGEEENVGTKSELLMRFAPGNEDGNSEKEGINGAENGDGDDDADNRGPSRPESTQPIIRREGNCFFLAVPSGPVESSTDDDVGDVSRPGDASPGDLHRTEEFPEGLDVLSATLSETVDHGPTFSHFSRYHDPHAVPLEEPRSPNVTLLPEHRLEHMYSTLNLLANKLQRLKMIETREKTRWSKVEQPPSHSPSPGSDQVTDT
uniref:rho guanine nucleotide exchange factor 11-like n=1 Tax=Myxine glutinosa TaxID=7769 RepID=UPI00358E482C